MKHLLQAVERKRVVLVGEVRCEEREVWEVKGRE